MRLRAKKSPKSITMVANSNTPLWTKEIARKLLNEEFRDDGCIDEGKESDSESDGDQEESSSEYELSQEAVAVIHLQLEAPSRQTKMMSNSSLETLKGFVGNYCHKASKNRRHVTESKKRLLSLWAMCN